MFYFSLENVQELFIRSRTLNELKSPIADFISNVPFKIVAVILIGLR